MASGPVRTARRNTGRPCAVSDNIRRDYPHFVPPREEIFPWAVAALLIVKSILARYLVFGEAFGPGALSEMLIILALVGTCMAIGGRSGRMTLGAISIVVSAAVLGTVVYASYFNQVPSFRMLGAFGQAGSLGEDVGGLLTWTHLLFVIDMPLVLWAMFFRDAPRRPGSRRARPALVGASALLGFFAFVVAAHAGGSTADSLKASYEHGITAFQVSSLMATEPVPVVEIDTAESAKLVQAQIDELTLHQDGVRREGAPTWGAMEGYNLILIQAEALQDGLIGARINGEPVMPNLEKLASQSLYFPNTYSQTGRGNTADAEFIANTSLYPGIDVPASVAYSRKQLPGLPSMFKAAGYESYTFHTNDARFWNRFQMYPALGFDRYYDKEWFGTKDVTRYGSSDRVLFAKVSEELLDKAVGGTRFYAHVVTVSAHYPYTAVASRGTLKLPAEIENTTTGRYLQSQSYFDAQLGRFLARMSADGLLENTVVVLYGDHFGMRFGNESDAERAFRKKLVGHGYNRADYYNIPFMIRLPGGDSARRYEAVLGQVDIMPTMADLFGLDITGVPHFGRSAFVQTPSVMTRGSDPTLYLDGDTLFIAGVTKDKDKRYVSSGQEKIEAGARPELLGNTIKLLELSDSYAASLPERPDASDDIGVIPSSAMVRGK